MKSKIWCLGLISLTLLWGTSCSRVTSTIPTTTSPNANNEAQKVKYVLGEAALIAGTDYLMAPVYTDGASRDRGWSSSSPDATEYGGKGYGSIRNFVIINRQDLSSRKLFANNQAIILDEKKLGEVVKPATKNEASPEAGQPVVKNITAVMYRVAKADTNGDKVIDQRDRQEIALADVDGTNYKELITGIDRVINIHSQSKDKRVVLYRVGQDNFSASIDIPSRSVVTKKLAPLTE
jgi:hypothetical protein